MGHTVVSVTAIKQRKIECSIWSSRCSDLRRVFSAEHAQKVRPT